MSEPDAKLRAEANGFLKDIYGEMYPPEAARLELEAIEAQRHQPDSATTERVREDIGELAQKAATELYDRGQELDRIQREQAARHRYEERETHYCLVHHRVDLAAGRTWFEAETITPLPFGLKSLRTVGPSAERALRRMHWVYAHALVNAKLGFTEPEARKRAARARFVQAEVLR